MRKEVAILAVLIMLVSGLGMGMNTGVKDKGVVGGEREKVMTLHFRFTKPEIKYEKEYAIIKMEGMHSLVDYGKPIIPYETKVLTFPLGTHVKVWLNSVDYGEEKTTKLVMPGHKAIKLGVNAKIERKLDEKVYGSSSPYPATWYRYRLAGGLYNGKHDTILIIQIFPVRYYPLENKIQYARSINISVEYEEPTHPLLSNIDTYDLLIIAPSEWQSLLQPLVEHKEKHGVKTLFMSVEDILSNYNGRDGAEKVKYAIKDAIEQYGIKYVLLVGGKKSMWVGNWGYDGPNKVDDSLWWTPVRYSALKDYINKSEIGECGYLSDLYFADIYDANGSFSSWDSNHDGKFAEWTQNAVDVLDLYPDVYVGRWPARNEQEVKTMVEKTIAYESQAAGPWFYRMLLVGGDTFPGDPAGVYDGEYATSYEYSFMPSQFTATKLYASDGSLTGGKNGKLAYRLAWRNVVREFNKGFGFVAFDGHGSPTVWGTHPVGDNRSWIIGLETTQMKFLKNGNKLPIVSVGGCHNSEFNISFFDFIKNEWTFQPTFECWSWHLTRQQGGGAIATIGYTGLGYGTIGDENKDGIPDCVQRFGGYIEALLFHAYGIEGKHVLGEAWATAIEEYLNTYPIDWTGGIESDTQGDCKTVEEWCLIGDPSLQIGGYS